MFTLFGAQGSGSAAVEMALERCALPYRIVRAATWEADSALAELARVNPLQQIPTLQLPDGSVLSESAAILIHLGLAYPAAALLPAELPARAQAIRGLVYIAANCYSAIGVIDYPERWLGPAGEDDDATRKRLRRGARERLHLHWSHFADQFPLSTSRPFLCGGDAPGALDMLAVVVSHWSGARTFLREKRPQFHALLERIEADPGVAPVFARHWPG